MPEISSEQATLLGQSFAAIDFETATSERRSACAVGVVVFEQGLPTDTLNLLIRPPGNDYDSNAAGLLWLALPDRFSTTPSDLLATHGYRLGYCHLDGYRPFSNATPSSSGSSRSLSAKHFTPRGEPDPEGLLFSKRIVFTGTLATMPRREAFQAAVNAGAKPSQSVSKRTSYVVVGSTDLRRVGESGRSSKHRKAVALATEGSPIEIIDEDQFICLLAGTA